MIIYSLFGGLALVSVCSGFFNFFHQGQETRPPSQGRVASAQDHEQAIFELSCSRYLCPDTGICMDRPSLCPCPYPSSQLRCELPGDRYLCISKPLGDRADEYIDENSNWKIDANDDTIRDCGWVKRAWKGVV